VETHAFPGAQDCTKPPHVIAPFSVQALSETRIRHRSVGRAAGNSWTPIDSRGNDKPLQVVRPNQAKSRKPVVETHAFPGTQDCTKPPHVIAPFSVQALSETRIRHRSVGRAARFDPVHLATHALPLRDWADRAFELWTPIDSWGPRNEKLDSQHPARFNSGLARTSCVHPMAG